MVTQFYPKVQEIVTVSLDAATAVDRIVWTCPTDGASYRLARLTEVHSTVGGAAAAVRPRKVTGTSAPGAAAGATVIELTAAIDLTAAVNTVVTVPLTASQADLLFKGGERIALDASGTVTGLVGAVLTFYLVPANSRL